MRECLREHPPENVEDAVSEAIDIFRRFSSSLGPVPPD
jgi:hypothetical protein